MNLHTRPIVFLKKKLTRNLPQDIVSKCDIKI